MPQRRVGLTISVEEEVKEIDWLLKGAVESATRRCATRDSELILPRAGRAGHLVDVTGRARAMPHAAVRFPRRLLLYVQLRGRLDPPRAATKTGGFRSQAEGEPTRGSLRRYRSLLGVSG